MAAPCKEKLAQLLGLEGLLIWIASRVLVTKGLLGRVGLKPFWTLPWLGSVEFIFLLHPEWLLLLTKRPLSEGLLVAKAAPHAPPATSPVEVVVSLVVVEPATTSTASAEIIIILEGSAAASHEASSAIEAPRGWSSIHIRSEVVSETVRW